MPIVSNSVNSVAITTLENSPIDPETGLPRPTIAVGTAGGLSTITNSGTVVNSTATTSVVSVDFDGKTLKAVRSDGIVAIYDDVTSIGVAPSTTLSASTIPALLGTASKGTTRAKGSSTGLTLIKRNPTTLASSMVARVTERAPAFWQIGDIRFAGLADTVAETVTATTPLNETFATDVDAAGFAAAYPGWTAVNSAVLSVVSNKLRITAGGTLYPMARRSITTVVGVTYKISIDISGYAGDATVAYINVHLTNGATSSGSATVITAATVATFTADFTATTTATALFIPTSGTTTGTVDFDNISVKLADPDRSVKNAGMVVVGEIKKRRVDYVDAGNVGTAGLVAYSGFSTANYLEQPYNSQLDFGTGDFSIVGWVKTSSATDQAILNRGASSGQMGVRITSTSFINIDFQDGVGNRYNVGSTATVTDGLYHFIVARRVSGVITLYVDAVQQTVSVYTNTGTGQAVSVSNTSAVTRIGVSQTATEPNAGSLALWRISATAPSQEQISQTYRDELTLFQPNAQCTIAGTSPAVTALAYDDSTNILKVGTTYGVSSFKGLQRISSDTVAALGTTTVTSIASSGGMTVVGGSAGSNLYVPARYLRDELQRREEARKALGRVQVFFPFAAATSQVAFSIPAGYTTRAVYSAGSLKDLGSSLDYTVNTDGYKETVTFAVAPGNGVRVNVMAFRNY